MNCAKQQLLLFSADVNNATQESGVNQAYGRALVHFCIRKKIFPWYQFTKETHKENQYCLQH